MLRERAVSSPTYCKIPGTSIKTRNTQEYTSTQADTNELSAVEKKERERWSESQTKTLVCGRINFMIYILQNNI